MQRRSRALLGVLFALALLAAACGKSSDATANSPGTGASAKAPGTGGTAVGFIFVGPKDDFGYNQAAYEGSQAVGKAFPDLKMLTAENVPETTTPSARHGGHDQQGRQDHLRHELRPPRPPP